MKHSKVLCVCVCLWVGGVDSCHYQSVELEQLIAKLPAVFAFQNIPLFADFSSLALTQSDSRLRQDPRVHTTGPVCARARSVQCVPYLLEGSTGDARWRKANCSGAVFLEDLPLSLQSKTHAFSSLHPALACRPD